MTDQEAQRDLLIGGTKATVAWGAVGISSWSDVAALLAALYTALLIVEWVWKRIARPAAEKRGLVKRKSRRASDD